MGPGEGAGSRSRLGLGDEWTGPSLPLPGPGAAECLACVGSGRGVGGVVVALRCRGELGGPGPDSRARGSPRSETDWVTREAARRGHSSCHPRAGRVPERRE